MELQTINLNNFDAMQEFKQWIIDNAKLFSDIEGAKRYILKDNQGKILFTIFDDAISFHKIWSEVWIYDLSDTSKTIVIEYINEN